MTASRAGRVAGGLPPSIGGENFCADPYPAYEAIQAAASAVFSESEQTWLVTRYEHVAAALRDPRLSKRTADHDPSPLARTMLFQDPPAHGRLRAAVADWFTPARVRSLEPRIGQIVDRLLDRLGGARRMDFIADFAMPLPVAVIADFLGVPEADWAPLHLWSTALAQTNSQPLEAEAFQRLQGEAIRGMAAYFERHIDQHRRRPQDDLVTALIHNRDGDRTLTSQELVGTCMLLLIAGHETTVNLLGNGLATLLAHPDEYARLHRDPGLLPGAIEEMLRYESPVQRGTFRVASEPLDIGGVRIEPGATVAAIIGAANRDPAVFPNPHRFDIGRSPNRHLAFGAGIHACLGAMLARTEARIGFERLFERLGVMRHRHALRFSLGPVRRWLGGRHSRALAWQSSTMVRGLSSLHVAW